MDFFRTAGKDLAAAEAAAGVKLHVALSVVGTERLQDSGYFRAKLVQPTDDRMPTYGIALLLLIRYRPQGLMGTV
jgi:hypothetical protein